MPVPSAPFVDRAGGVRAERTLSSLHSLFKGTSLMPTTRKPLLVALLVLVVAGLGCPDRAGRDVEAQAPAEPPVALAPLPAPALLGVGAAGSPIADVAERSVESVVNISSEKLIRGPSGNPFGPFFDDPFFRQFFGDRFRFPEIPPERRERSLGSGVIVSEDGIVLTNNHVVESAEDVRVSLSDEREFAATVVGTDPQSDLAVLRIEGELGDVEPLALGDSDRLRLGDVVLAIGNPFGVGQTVTMGIISAVGRANVGIVDYEDFIQTDAAINPGNSGGALVDMEGNLVGINTAIISRSGGYQGIGFAIPSNMARRIMDSLIETGRVERGWLGVAIQDMTQELAESFDLATSRGVLVADVVPDGPAEAAGLKRGDVILRIDGASVDDMGRLRNLVASAGVGAKLRLEVLREGEERSFEVELGARPDQEAQLARGRDAEKSVLRGLRVAPVDASTRRRFDIADDVRSGVVILDVAANSPASAAGLRPGDVILEADRREVRSVRDLEARLREKRGRVLLLISRASGAFFVPLEGDG